MEAQGHSYQAIIHSPAQMDLVYRLRGQGPGLGENPEYSSLEFPLNDGISSRANS